MVGLGRSLGKGRADGLVYRTTNLDRLNSGISYDEITSKKNLENNRTQVSSFPKQWEERINESHYDVDNRAEPIKKTRYKIGKHSKSLSVY